MRAASEARQFSGETWRVLTNLPKEQVGKIIAAALSQALWATFHSKKIAIREAGKLTVKLGKQIWVFLKHEACTLNEERELYLQNIGPRFERTGRIWRRALRKNALSKLAAFRALSLAEKKDIVVSGFLWLGTFFLVGGGLDFEGGAPDLDIKVGGIGQHRNLISHTILLGLFLEFLLRLAVGLFRAGKEYLPQEKSLIWKQVKKIAIFLEKNENVLVSGMWTGLAVHLLKDASLGAARTKPYTDIPFSMPTEAHQALFAGNSFFSFLFGKNPAAEKEQD